MTKAIVHRTRDAVVPVPRVTQWHLQDDGPSNLKLFAGETHVLTIKSDEYGRAYMSRLHITDALAGELGLVLSGANYLATVTEKDRPR